MTTVTMQEEWQPVQGKMVAFIMTFKGDEKCLYQCIRGIEEQQKKGYDIDIYIIDDGTAPLENIPPNTHYRKSFYPRNNNLNGVSCCMGMLMDMLRAARESKAEYILKVDSDMYIRNLDRFLKPLKDDTTPVIGFQLKPTMNYAAGVTYLLPSKGLYNAIKNFQKWYKEEQHTSPHCPEDWAITRCMATVNNYILYQWNNYSDPEQWLLTPFNFTDIKNGINSLSFTKCVMYDFVNFGNRHQLDVENPREVAAECMKQFIDYDLLNEMV